MWESFLTWLILAPAILVGVTEGLECYSCWSEDAATDAIYKEHENDGIVGDKSCRRGLIPDSRLKKTCPNVTDEDGNVIPPVCSALYAKFPIMVLRRRHTFIVALRGCFHANSSVEDLAKLDPCTKKTHKNLAALEVGLIGTILRRIPLQFPSNMTADFCFCQGDNCNPASGLEVNMKLMGLVLGMLISLSSYSNFH